MPQFDVYRNPDARSRARFPFLLDIQSDLLESLATRVVVPLAAATDDTTPIARLMPVFEIEGRHVVMRTAEIAGVPRKAIGAQVGSLAGHRHEIVAALDVLVSGV
ncbi:MAG: plasmid maintenance protein CcdB [Burkholderiales bacterium]|nr:MAG: plasmid maintenance protein CcdB [Burkholderiales bacterium]